MKALIIEDEIIIAAELSDSLQEIGHEVCGMAVNYTNAIALLESEKPDIAIIDINIGGTKTGIDVGRYINEHNKIPFIYLTSNVDKATVDEALSTKPNAYLPKPFNKTLLYSSLELALNDFRTKTQSAPDSELIVNNAIFIKEKDSFVKVPLEEILYFKSDKNYIEAVTAKKRHIIRSSFSNLLDGKLNTIFFRVHKSYAVNVQQVQSISQDNVVVSNNDSVPLSESHRSALLERLQKFS